MALLYHKNPGKFTDDNFLKTLYKKRCPFWNFWGNQKGRCEYLRCVWLNQFKRCIKRCLHLWSCKKSRSHFTLKSRTYTYHIFNKFRQKHFRCTSSVLFNCLKLSENRSQVSTHCIWLWRNKLLLTFYHLHASKGIILGEYTPRSSRTSIKKEISFLRALFSICNCHRRFSLSEYDKKIKSSIEIMFLKFSRYLA